MAVVGVAEAWHLGEEIVHLVVFAKLPAFPFPVQTPSTSTPSTSTHQTDIYWNEDL